MNAGVWRVAAASVVGSSHERMGLQCQDAHKYQELNDGTLIAVVADGAGSASHAEAGASVATEAALAALAASIAKVGPGDASEWKQLLREAVVQARDAVANKAAELDAPLRELASTLLIVIARPDLLVAGQIGDGAVVFVNGAAELLAATRPSHGEHANETYFLTSLDALERLQVEARPGPLTRLAMFSDGLERVALSLPTGDPYPGFFNPLFRLLEHQDDQQMKQSVQSLLNMPRLRERSDDDLTLLLAAPGSALADVRPATIDE